ncbi:hypothetical protein TNCV_3674261 [Trichonephila clavipes]|nr:hypothetical protein TNCV_3674261 [Trichonephila clavipes]
MAWGAIAQFSTYSKLKGIGITSGTLDNLRNSNYRTGPIPSSDTLLIVHHIIRVSLHEFNARPDVLEIFHNVSMFDSVYFFHHLPHLSEVA